MKAMQMCRQVDALSGRVDKLPSPEDWSIMEQALAAILDEAAARAQEEDRLAEEAAQRGGGPLDFLRKRRKRQLRRPALGKAEVLTLAACLQQQCKTLRIHWWSQTRYQRQSHRCMC